MPWPMASAVFFTTWWIVLFAVLPLTNRPQDGDRPEDWPEGADAGAPSRLRLWRAVLWTTLAATAILAGAEAYAFWVA